jgi:hypothetical protein
MMCDFSGFPCQYRHKNGMRFTTSRHFKDIEKMQKTKIDEYLALRNAQIVMIK